MVKRVCDRCGAEMKDHELHGRDYKIINCSSEYYINRPSIDLCTSCYDTFLEFMHKAKPWWEDKK